MKTHKAWLLATTICAADLLIAGAAFAQTAPDAPSTAVEEVIVTGSRIARRDYAAESPIVTVGQDVLKSSGAVTVEASLNQLPQFTASAGAGTGGAGNANRGGQASANLRSLGPQRTLVLLDGRRMQPSNADGTVDLNTLPDMLIDNVEVITGGASAAYGSDAVAGVVNFKLKRNIDGMIVDAQYGVTGEGDGQTLNLGVAIGSKFAEDRGGAMLAISFADRKPVYAPDRDFFKYSKVTTALPQANALSARLSAPGSKPAPATLSTLNRSPSQANDGHRARHTLRHRTRFPPRRQRGARLAPA